MDEIQLAEDPLPATAILPNEIWEKVLCDLKSSPKSILQCRQVCKNFKSELDFHLNRWAKPSELDRIPMNVKKLCRTKIKSLEEMMDFTERMNNDEDENPFPSRVLQLNPFPQRTLTFPRVCGCRICCNCKEYILELYKMPFQFQQFSNRFGKYVNTLELTIMDKPYVSQLPRSLFPNFPNIIELDIKLVASSYVNDFNWLEYVTFPPLVNLTNLKLHCCNVNGAMIATHLFKAYGKQLKSLTLSGRFTTYTSEISFGQLTSELLPKLINLKIRDFLITLESPGKMVMNDLKMGKWQLKQLTFSEEVNINDNVVTYNFRDVMDVVSKLAPTLEILHLYISEGSRTMFRLRGLSKPNCPPQEVADELQIKVTLPRLQELSVNFTCFSTACLAISKFCEKCTYLKTIHVSDRRLKREAFIPNYTNELNEKWWPVLSPTSQLDRVIFFSGDEFRDDVVAHKVINKPDV